MLSLDRKEEGKRMILSHKERREKLE